MQSKDSPGYTKPIQVRVGPDIHQWLKEVAVREDRSVNYIINQVLVAARAKQETQGTE